VQTSQTTPPQTAPDVSGATLTSSLLDCIYMQLAESRMERADSGSNYWDMSAELD